MSKTSIEEPFQLANYTSSFRWKEKKSTLDHVYVSQLSGPLSKSRREGFVTVSAQGDGVHIVDISTLHPLVSHTLGPSASFSCPSLTTEAEENQYITYAVIESSSESTSTKDSGRVIWKWNSKPEAVASVTESQKKTAKTIVPAPQRIHGLHSNIGLANRIFALTQSGTLIALDADTLEEKATIQASSDESSRVVKAFLFSASQCSFSNSTTGVLAVVALSTKSGLQIKVFAIDEMDTYSTIGDYAFNHKEEQIYEISCNQTGYFSVLCKNGEWFTYLLSSDSQTDVSTGPTHLSPLSPPLKLANLSFPSISSSKTTSSTSPPSLLSLTSSHALLAATSQSATDIHLQIWDLQYSVLLAVHTVPIPTAFLAAPFTMRLGSRGPDVSSTTSAQTSISDQALLVLSPAVSSSKDSASQNVTSSVLVVPYTVPYRSTIAAAIGRGAFTKAWLKSADNAKSSPVKKSSVEAGREKMIASVRSALEAGQVKVADKAFSSWLELSEKASKGETQPTETTEPSSPSPVFTHSSVKELIAVLLPPVKPSGKTAAHSPEILRSLLQRSLVSNSMIEGGLISALKARSDWTSIEIAFGSVQDLPVADIIECLATVTRRHRQPSSNADVMQVDPEPSTPITSLPTFLSHVINYQSSATPSQVVLALKRYFRDPEDVRAVAQVLATWIRSLNQQRKSQNLAIWPSNKDMELNQHGVWVFSLKNKERRSTKSAAKKAGGPPVFEKVIVFLQSFLDACFLSLLQHPPSHPLLSELQNYLGDESAFSDSLIQLQGSLEPFSITHQKMLREAAVPEKERERQKQKGDWRQRRNGAAGVIGAVGAVGVYQLEELAF
ncbi:hypothetical protein FA15DRAFT_664615 [Coprinopsis marcescibilis]|uniref:Uncharacterized protein n=1 Tax=Coprinopsis marcescibilis TaxID=230819 RepID=A0A5C3L886_COPMA|nr:hypothetical protein FA15DRAFT_664615 [Coprinopsis marcescibilis]